MEKGQAPWRVRTQREGCELVLESGAKSNATRCCYELMLRADARRWREVGDQLLAELRIRALSGSCPSVGLFDGGGLQTTPSRCVAGTASESVARVVTVIY